MLMYFYLLLLDRSINYHSLIGLIITFVSFRIYSIDLIRKFRIYSNEIARALRFLYMFAPVSTGKLSRDRA
jgi:hypothetical protein